MCESECGWECGCEYGSVGVSVSGCGLVGRDVYFSVIMGTKSTFLC